MYHIKEDARSLQSVEWLLVALGELMKTAAFSQIKVVQLAAKAGLSRSTFYRNFDETEDLLRYMVDRDFSDLFAAVLGYYREQTVSGKGFRTAFVVPFLRFWESRFRTVELIVLAGRESFLLAAFGRHARKVLSLSENSNFLSDEAKEYFVAMRSGEAIGLLIYWVSQGRSLSQETLSNLVIAQTLESFDMDLNLRREPVDD